MEWSEAESEWPSQKDAMKRLTFPPLGRSSLSLDSHSQLHMMHDVTVLYIYVHMYSIWMLVGSAEGSRSQREKEVSVSVIVHRRRCSGAVTAGAGVTHPQLTISLVTAAADEWNWGVTPCRTLTLSQNGGGGREWRTVAAEASFM